MTAACPCRCVGTPLLLIGCSCVCVLQIGNGGFSFRKKSAMLRCMEQRPYQTYVIPPPTSEEEKRPETRAIWAAEGPG